MWQNKHKLSNLSSPANPQPSVHCRTAHTSILSPTWSTSGPKEIPCHATLRYAECQRGVFILLEHILSCMICCRLILRSRESTSESGCWPTQSNDNQSRTSSLPKNGFDCVQMGSSVEKWSHGFDRTTSALLCFRWGRQRPAPHDYDDCYDSAAVWESR